MKKFSCKNVSGIDCSHDIEAETVTELIQKAKNHAEENHPKLWDKVKRMSDEEVEKLISSEIKEK